MISLRHLISLILLTCVTVSYGQTPQNILLQPSPNSGERACPDRNAGTVALGAHLGQSNDISLNRSYLCLNDRLNFVHNGDQEVMDSDPNPATTPGVGYIWYTCNPTVARASLADIQTDPCLLTNPTPALGAWVYVDDINGDALFQNSNQIGGQSIPDFFNSGEPIELWFAPFTIDAVSGGQPVLEGSPAGPCVHSNVNAAFSIVYLTPMSVQNRTVVSDGAGGCLGSFEVTGGLPQFETSTSYSFTIEHASMPGVFGTVLGTNHGDGDEVQFSFTEEGRYIVTVEDGKSCMIEFEIDVACLNANDPVTFNIGSATLATGATADIPITVENFDSLGAISFELRWDPTVFEYVSNSGYLIDADPISNFNDLNVDEGRLIVSWLARNLFTGQIEPDGTVFFTTEFRAVGECGESTDIFFAENAIVVDYINRDLLYEVNEGVGQIEIGSFALNAQSCPDDGTGIGSVTLTACGGLAPYMINWVGPSPGSTNLTEQNGTITFPNLLAGMYTFSVEDANGVIVNEMITISIGSAPDVQATITNPFCSNSPTGSIDIDIVPNQAYEIEWSTNEFNTETILNLTNGQYSVTVTDPSGCEVSESYTVNAEPIVISPVIQNATCVSSENGSIAVTALGGTPYSNGDYVFQWDGFPPSQGNASSLPDLGMGTYRITVTDSNGCSTSASFDITADRRIVLDLPPDITNVECFGDSTGSMEIKVSTLNATNDAGYLYEWQYNNTGVSSSFGSMLDFSTSLVGLPAGEYFVTVTDFDEGLDCVLDTSFIIEQPDEIIVELIDFQEASCSDMSDGELTVRITGGSDDPLATFFLQWDGPSTVNGQVSQDGLAAGRYDLTVIQLIDGTITSCSIDTFFIMTQEVGPEILDINVQDVSCGGGMDGELEVLYSPPGAVFDVTWEDESRVTYTGNPATGLAAGKYYVTVDAGMGCMSIDSATILGGTGITIDSIVYDTPTCPNSGNGAVTIFAQGPGQLSYAWDHPNGSDNNRLPSVPVGTYTVTITAAGSGCPPLIIDTLNVPSPDIFMVDFTNIMGATCPGICNGGATITATGGAGTITYSWTSGENTATASALCPGENFVTVTDGLCADVFMIDIPSADSIAMVSEFENPTCFGDTDGFIRISPSGTNPPFDIMWDDGPIIPNRLNLGEGQYIVTVMDAMGCSRIDTFNLVAPDLLVATILPEDLNAITCAGRDDGSALVTVTGGNGNNTFTWTPDVSQTSAAQGLAPGNYTVFVEDEEGCNDMVMFDMSEPDAIQFVLGEQSEIACFGETAEFTVDTAFSGAGGPFTFTINSGASHPLGETVTLFGGDYTISVIDTSGCFVDTMITIAQPDEFSIDLGEDMTVNLGDSARLDLVGFSGSFPIDSFIWSSSGNDLSCLTCPSPWIIPVVDATVNLTAIDASGCEATDEILVFVDASRNVYIPNAFSPNNDGINDVFEVFTGIGVRRIASMRIFNRWGGEVFERFNLPATSRGSGGWNGTNRDQLLTPGVYAYVIEVEFADNQIINYTGEVQLMR